MSAPDWAQLVLFAAAIGLILYVGYLLVSNREDIFQYMREAHYKPLAIATTPSGATVNLDGKEIGRTPITINTYAGAHTVTVKKEGFIEQSLAVNLEDDRYERTNENRSRLVYSAKPWILNLNLEPQHSKLTTAEEATLPLENRQSPLISQTIPTPSSTAEPIKDQASLMGRIELIENRLSAVDQKIDLAVTLKLGVLGTLAAVFFAFIAFLVGMRRRAS